MNGVFLEDGYTEPFRINAVEGMHGQLCGNYRPMLVDERDTMFQKAMEKKSRVEQNSVYRRVVASKLIDWNAKDSTGAAHKPTEHYLRHLHPVLWDKLFGIITGERKSDLPDSPQEPAADIDDLDMAMNEAAEGRAAPDKLEADLKN